MLRYTLRRAFMALLVAFTVSVATFILLHAATDPAQAIAGPDADARTVQQVRVQYGLDRALAVQYAEWLGGVVRGNLGVSYHYHRDVGALGRALFNRLGPVAEELCPGVRDARRALEQLHPAGVLMSGSGSTVFAVCRGPGEACRVARELRSPREETDGPRVFVVQSCP